MRASFQPNLVEIAVLVGWKVYEVLRERVGQLRARFPTRAVPVSADAQANVEQLCVAVIEDRSFPDDTQTRFEDALIKAGVDEIATYPASRGWVFRDSPSRGRS
jgi:hypothetical protein